MHSAHTQARKSLIHTSSHFYAVAEFCVRVCIYICLFIHSKALYSNGKASMRMANSRWIDCWSISENRSHFDKCSRWIEFSIMCRPASDLFLFNWIEIQHPLKPTLIDLYFGHVFPISTLTHVQSEFGLWILCNTNIDTYLIKMYIRTTCDFDGNLKMYSKLNTLFLESISVFNLSMEICHNWKWKGNRKPNIDTWLRDQSKSRYCRSKELAKKYFFCVGRRWNTLV